MEVGNDFQASWKCPELKLSTEASRLPPRQETAALLTEAGTFPLNYHSGSNRGA